MTKKMIFLYWFLCLLLSNNFSFSMQPDPLVYDQLHNNQNHLIQEEESDDEDDNLPAYNEIQAPLIQLPDDYESEHLDHEMAQKIVNASPIMKSIGNTILLQQENIIIHRYLFLGQLASGKTTAARALATITNKEIEVIDDAFKIDFNQPAGVRPTFESKIPRSLFQHDESILVIIKHIDQLDAFASFYGDKPEAKLRKTLLEIEEYERRRNANHFIFVATARNRKNIPYVLADLFINVNIEYPDHTCRTAILEDLLKAYNRINVSDLAKKHIKAEAKRMENFSIEDIYNISQINYKG